MYGFTVTTPTHKIQLLYNHAYALHESASCMHGLYYPLIIIIMTATRKLTGTTDRGSRRRIRVMHDRRLAKCAMLCTYQYRDDRADYVYIEVERLYTIKTQIKG